MDIVEFAENICGAKLTNWQKHHTRFLYELTRKYDVRVVMGKNGQVFTYIKQKESISDGNTSVSK